MDIREIKNRLSGQAEAVCVQLLPGGRKIGHEWVFDPGSGKIKVHLTGAKAGVWSHFGGEGGGDLIDLWATQCDIPLAQALREIKTWLGIEDPGFTGPKTRSYTRPRSPQGSKAAGPGSQVEIYLMSKRGLLRETIKAFRIGQADLYQGVGDRGAYSIEGPWVLFPFMRVDQHGVELINMKWLHVERRVDSATGRHKKRIIQEKNAEPCLFGWQAVDLSTRAVVICEGEIDAMTWRQYGYYALSVPAGAGTGHKNDWIDTEWEDLARFEDIFLSFDQDPEGKVAVADIVARLGIHRCRIVHLPHKDINKCLTEGVTTEEVRELITNAEILSPKELRSAREFVEQVIDEFYPQDQMAAGYEIPFTKMGKFRIRLGETTAVTGINGHGKSAIISQVCLYLADNGARCMTASMEMRPVKTLARMVQQIAGELLPGIDHIRAIHDWFDGRMWIYNVHGSTETGKLLEVMLYARRRFGVTIFVIDSLMRCGIAVDDYEGQDQFMKALCAFNENENTHTFLIAHSRKQQDDSKPVGRLDIKGSGGLTDNAYNCLSVWRNKGKEIKLQDLRDDPAATGLKKIEREADLIAKPDAMLICDKQRHGGGWEGRARLWFNPDTVLFRESRSGDPAEFRTTPKAIDNPIPF